MKWLKKFWRWLRRGRTVAIFDEFAKVDKIDEKFIELGRQTGKTQLTVDAVRSAADATWGHIWVKNDDPNTLWFTDDDGTDFQLGTSPADYKAHRENRANG